LILVMTGSVRPSLNETVDALKRLNILNVSGCPDTMQALTLRGTTRSIASD
jgi:hypothetical protein